MIVKLEIFPNFRGEHKKYLSCHHSDPMGFPPFGVTTRHQAPRLWGHKKSSPTCRGESTSKVMESSIRSVGSGAGGLPKTGEGIGKISSRSRIFILYVFVLSLKKCIYKKICLYMYEGRCSINSQIKPCKSPPYMMMGVERNK